MTDQDARKVADRLSGELQPRGWTIQLVEDEANFRLLAQSPTVGMVMLGTVQKTKDVQELEVIARQTIETAPVFNPPNDVTHPDTINTVRAMASAEGWYDKKNVLGGVLGLLVMTNVLTQSEAKWVAEAGPLYPDPWTAPYIHCHSGWLTVTLAIGNISSVRTFDCNISQGENRLAVDLEIPQFRKQLEAVPPERPGEGTMSWSYDKSVDMVVMHVGHGVSSDRVSGEGRAHLAGDGTVLKIEVAY